MRRATLSLVFLVLAILLTASVRADQVFNDDVIVDGSMCVGFDCVVNMNFGFDTLVLRENNLRILADDSSTTSNFPDNDWRLTFNESLNGGLEKFSVDDVSAGRSPFTIEAGAPNHALYIEADGDVGVGTNSPATELHLLRGDTPTLRLQQDGSGGWSPQTWDIAGNETNFFIRDVTNGSKLPLRIRPNAPTSSIDIANDGDVGFGTSSPEATLHTKRTSSGLKAMLKMENNGGSWMEMENTATGDTWYFTHQDADQGLFILDSVVDGVPDGPEFSFTHDGNLLMNNNGGLYLELKNSATNDTWYFTHENTDAGRFIVASVVDGVPDGPEFALDVSGNLSIAGTLSQGSSREVKEQLVPVDGRKVLDAVNRLEINTWKYRDDASGTRHMGPMAEDFHRAFEVGVDDRHLSSADTAGAALASVQELSRQNRELRARLERIERLLSLR